MNPPFPKPRYETGQRQGRSAIIDTTRNETTMDRPRSYPEACRIASALNREYQKWLTERFYERAGAS